LELSKEQHNILERTAPVKTPAEFQALLAQAKPRMAKMAKEIQEPNQPMSTTLTELRDLALTVEQHTAQLDAVKYGADKRAQFLDSIRLLDTAQLWFGEGHRTGAFKVRSVAEVVEASRPWRRRLKAYADHAFAENPALAEPFADVNSSGTLDEEIADLRALNQGIEQNREAFDGAGITEEFVQQGITLYDEASGRDLEGILGVRNRAEAIELRNRILTYAIALGREARAAGVNGCYEDETARKRFEAASFRDAMRALRPRRGRPASKEQTGDPPPVPATASAAGAANQPAGAAK
jgi:hypothetical protein